ncbi:MAG TPA: energy transducer TonB [Candidatus Dormibacteraeota bacterium]|nr:energy transducer TonB [Candidatus Dormibacteraeota bacterium]
MRQGAAVVLFFFSLIAVLPTQARAQESAEARRVLIKTQAVYPTLARSMNIHGVVKIEALVLPNGTVKTMDVKGGHPLLTQSAVTAVGHWKFEPAPKETKELVEIKFDPE